APPPRAEYVGLWGPNPAACGARSRRRGYIPAMISQERAQAGRTICNFHDGHRSGNTWVMAAECSDRGRRWSSQVRLMVEGDRLTWSSAKGSASYVRCNRRAG
ncbi:peptidase inhibitor family I36 protein, partial [Methylobacterium trifolii]